jgi:hypothetical protein
LAFSLANALEPMAGNGSIQRLQPLGHCRLDQWRNNGDPRTPSSRNTSPSTHRTCLPTSRACDTGPRSLRRSAWPSNQWRAHASPCACNMPMICSSLRILRFIIRPFLGADSRRN